MRDASPVTVIEPPRGFLAPDLLEIWRHRELLYFLVWRDITVRYKQTIVGAAWAVLQPFATMVVFTLFFGALAGLPSDGLPHPVFYYSGLLPWMYFATALQTATNSVVEHQRIVTKVYFPRVLLPMAGVLPGLLDGAIAFGMLLLMMAVYGVAPTASILLAPLVILVAALAALAVGLWLAALNAAYRDVRYVVPFLIQLWMFASPVAYPSGLVPERWRWLYGLNPMVGVIDTFRWAVTGAGRPSFVLLAAGTVATVVVLLSGLMYFGRVEQTVADIV